MQRTPLGAIAINILSLTRLFPLSARDCRAQVERSGDHRKGRSPLFSFSFKLPLLSSPPFPRHLRNMYVPHTIHVRQLRTL